MRDTTYARVTQWIETRTPSGNWSPQPGINRQSKDLVPHELSHFLTVRFPNEKRHMCHLKQGYLPYRITVPGPDKQTRFVYIIEYYDGPRERVTYTYE